MIDDVVQYLSDHHFKGRTVTLKVKYHNFQRVTRSITLRDLTSDADRIMKSIRQLLVRTDVGRKKVGLIGLSISNVECDYLKGSKQLELEF